ncbi:MAG: cell division protein ZapA [Clostridia bacterium]|nr:cell division protein ZapA [Clostridia bacterium]MBQ8371308.1 cell division protein ZapA [Clostridia bacterium]
MENVKKKITVEIVGDSMTLITDESDDFVREVAMRLNKRMLDLTRNNFRTSKYDAALLCALDAMSEKVKAEKRVRTVESQLSVAQQEIRRLEEKLASAESAPAEAKAPAEEPRPADESLSRMIRAASDGETSEDRVRALENYLDNKKSGDGGSQSREDKIKYIESLLRGND